MHPSARSLFVVCTSLLLVSGASLSACGGDSNPTGSSGTSTGTGASGGGTTTGGSGGGAPQVSYDCSAPDGAIPPLKLTEVSSDIHRPVLLIGSPGDDTRLFVVGQDGNIWIIKDGVKNPTPFLDVSALCVQPVQGDERGLLGLAFHPKYAENGRFFIFYTKKSNGHQIIAEYARGADADTANPTEVLKLLDVSDPEGNHNGGMLGFSPADGLLYIGMGDGGGAGDQHGAFGNGQNLGSLWGKLLRIDVDAAQSPYGIPAGNMTSVPAGNPTTDPVKPEIWDFGLRNPWRFSFDLCTNDLYIGDVGQDAFEEIDIESPGEGNKNYGWRVTEGLHCFNPTNCDPNDAMFTPPVAEYPHTKGCSVSGGYVYRGKKIPGLRGAYFYGDYCSGKIWSFSWTKGTMPVPDERTQELQSGSYNIVSFGQDNTGEIYVLHLGGNTGKIFRIDAQ